MPLAPTLNGWLLGYPIVYQVRTAEEAAAASSYLSSTSLALVRANAACAAVRSGAATVGVEEGRGRGRGRGAPGAGGGMLLQPWQDLRMLCSFSAPQALMPEDDDHADGAGAAGGVLEGRDGGSEAGVPGSGSGMIEAPVGAQGLSTAGEAAGGDGRGTATESEAGAAGATAAAAGAPLGVAGALAAWRQALDAASRAPAASLVWRSGALPAPHVTVQSLGMQAVSL